MGIRTLESDKQADTDEEQFVHSVPHSAQLKANRAHPYKL